MKVTGQALATGAILAALFMASRRFNCWIDNRSVFTPGATALQVVAGTGYTLAGVAAILAIWRGIRSAGVFVLAALAGFAASGIPMLTGDIRRDER
jgi:chromate transport protein ChrA